jgi:hypothetical protein
VNFFAIEMTRRRFASTISFTGPGLSRPRSRTKIMRMLYIDDFHEFHCLRNLSLSRQTSPW